MANFKGHEPCPNCGSRNNLGRYDDGSAFCFGCGHKERRTHAPVRLAADPAEDDSGRSYAIPADAGQHYGAAAVEWLSRFHMDIPTAIKAGILWSPSREQLIYQLGNCWQARNFRPDGGDGNAKRQQAKNFTSGDVNECLHMYTNPTSQRDVGENSVESGLVIVEDPVSAIRVASSGGRFDAMPLLGSHLASSRLNAIAGLYGDVVFWLDSDKYKEARAMCDRAKYMGLSARTIYTEEDPKCHSNEEIQKVLDL